MANLCETYSWEIGNLAARHYEPHESSILNVFGVALAIDSLRILHLVLKENCALAVRTSTDSLYCPNVRLPMRDLEQLISHCPDRCLSPIRDPDLPQNVLDMFLDGLVADSEKHSNFSIGHAGG